MSKLWRRFGLVGAMGLVAVVAMTAGVVAVAVGDESDDRDDPPRKAASAALRSAALSPQLFDLRDSFVDDVAKELDEDPAEVRAAVRRVAERWADRFVDDGLLSERNADALLECWDGRECDLEAVIPSIP